jgi:predicted transposase YdaD
LFLPNQQLQKYLIAIFIKTDSIFYRIFQTLPQSFFELINLPPSEANAYDFASVELKQTAFRIDGVFLPTNNQEKIPMSVEDLENLGLALLDFTSKADLVVWLNNQVIFEG